MAIEAIDNKIEREIVYIEGISVFSPFNHNKK